MSRRLPPMEDRPAHPPEFGLNFTHQTPSGIYVNETRYGPNRPRRTRDELDVTLRQYLNYAEDFGGPTGCRHVKIHAAVFKKDFISAGQAILLIKRSSEAAEYPSQFELPGSYLFREEESNFIGLKEGLRVDAGLQIKSYRDVVEYICRFRTNAPQPAINSDKPVDDPTMRTEHVVFAVTVSPTQKERIRLGDKHVTYEWAQEGEVDRLPMTDEMRKAVKGALEWANGDDS
ncbi:MAG: hypothetical protein M1831_004325 [Alyxoria varia]|nr:MAG: hypothetical protein M1831_004325 [Alyxoria varia]